MQCTCTLPLLCQKVIYSCSEPMLGVISMTLLPTPPISDKEHRYARLFCRQSSCSKKDPWMTKPLAQMSSDGAHISTKEQRKWKRFIRASIHTLHTRTHTLYFRLCVHRMVIRQELTNAQTFTSLHNVNLLRKSWINRVSPGLTWITDRGPSPSQNWGVHYMKGMSSCCR